MIVGLDFDNTIVSYEDSIEVLCEEVGLPISKGLNKKESLKESSIKVGGDQYWTFLQGELYGPKMEFAKPFENCFDALSAMPYEIKFIILSHRSPKPYGGQEYNLTEYAEAWINKNVPRSLLNRIEHIEFFESKKDKILAIQRWAPAVFIDDLTSIFLDPLFPLNVSPVLFDPCSRSICGFRVMTNWIDLKLIVDELRS